MVRGEAETGPVLANGELVAMVDGQEQLVGGDGVGLGGLSADLAAEGRIAELVVYLCWNNCSRGFREYQTYWDSQERMHFDGALGLCAGVG